MTFDQILDQCIDQIARGATLETCLAQYPDIADQLADSLHLYLALRDAAPPRLNAAAFERTRRAVRATAVDEQRVLAEGSPIEIGWSPHGAASRAAVEHLSPPLQSSAYRFKRQALPFSLRLLLAAASLLVLLALARGVANSLPGSSLYSTKRAVENWQGVLLTMAGNSTAWDVDQVEKRVSEALALTERGDALSDELLTEIERSSQRALTDSDAMQPAQRDLFLDEWVVGLADLHRESDARGGPGSDLSETLRRLELSALAEKRSASDLVILAPTATPELESARTADQSADVIATPTRTTLTPSAATVAERSSTAATRSPQRTPKSGEPLALGPEASTLEAQPSPTRTSTPVRRRTTATPARAQSSRRTTATPSPVPSPLAPTATWTPASIAAVSTQPTSSGGGALSVPEGTSTPLATTAIAGTPELETPISSASTQTVTSTVLPVSSTAAPIGTPSGTLIGTATMTSTVTATSEAGQTPASDGSTPTAMPTATNIPGATPSTSSGTATPTPVMATPTTTPVATGTSLPTFTPTP